MLNFAYIPYRQGQYGQHGQHELYLGATVIPSSTWTFGLQDDSLC